MPVISRRFPVLAAVFFALFLGILTPSVSYAEVKKFKFFSIDIPKGWEAKAEGDKSVTIKTKRKTDRSLLVGIDVVNRGVSVKDLANAFLNSHSLAKGATDISVERDTENYNITLYRKDGLLCAIVVVKLADGDDESIFKYAIVSGTSDDTLKIFGSMKIES
jgi:hypothetical protein